MSVGNGLRVAFVLAAGIAAAGSASSTSNNPPPQYQAQNDAQGQAPPPQQMEPATALGLWQSNFGAVKIEADNSKGGIAANAVQGVWVYTRQGQEVIGYFAGTLRGNVLDYRWQEPNNPPLTGSGFIVFDPQGRQYDGRWWSDHKDRVGAWNGWRNGARGAQPAYGQQQQYGQYGQQQQTYGYGQQSYGGQYGGNDPYGGQQYGGAQQPQQQPQPQQQNPQQQQYPQQQPPPRQPYRQPAPYQPPPSPRGYY
jgi:hypothetical protein